MNLIDLFTLDGVKYNALDDLDKKYLDDAIGKVKSEKDILLLNNYPNADINVVTTSKYSKKAPHFECYSLPNDLGERIVAAAFS